MLRAGVIVGLLAGGLLALAHGAGLASGRVGADSPAAPRSTSFVSATPVGRPARPGLSRDIFHNEDGPLLLAVDDESRLPSTPRALNRVRCNLPNGMAKVGCDLARVPATPSRGPTTLQQLHILLRI
jgi:hypothetical protein